MKLLWPACKILSCVQLQLSAELWKLIYTDCGPFDLIKYAPFIQHTSYKTHRGNSGQQWDGGRVVEGYWLLHSSISCFTQGQLLATWAAVVIPRWEISGANNFGWIFRMLLVGRLQVGRQAGQNCWREGKVWWWWIENREKLRLKVTKCFVLHQRKNCITTELHQQDDGPNPRAGPQLGHTMETGGDLDKNLTLKLGKCSRLSRLLTP